MKEIQRRERARNDKEIDKQRRKVFDFEPNATEEGERFWEKWERLWEKDGEGESKNPIQEGERFWEKEWWEKSLLYTKDIIGINTEDIENIGPFFVWRQFPNY